MFTLISISIVKKC